MKRFLIRFRYEIFALVGSVGILWGMLLPGYILTLDLIWTPHVPLVWDSNGFNNTYPVMAFFHILSFILPGWVGEKVMLIVLFFLLFYMPLRFLPWIEIAKARLFAASLYALNPFVYARMLAGQWLVLFGFALLPSIFFTLERFTTIPSKKNASYLGIALTVIGFFSIHFLYLSLLVSCLWILAFGIRNAKERKNMLTGGLYVVGIFLLLSSFWIIPTFVRDAPVDRHFDTTHFRAFAASQTQNGVVPAMLNVAVLGGYWGEKELWGSYFLWPQSHTFFWSTALLLYGLVAFGIWTAFASRIWRFEACLFIALGTCAYITALGAADTPFKELNSFLYAHVPMWSGLRDSQKIAGILAFIYTIFAAVAMDRIFMWLPKRHFVQNGMFIAMLTIPAVFGMYEWGGFSRQLQPVDFPNDWYQVKAFIDHAPQKGIALVLPWHGYMSFDFNHQLIISNPAPAFFGMDKTLSGKSIDLDMVHDQEVDPKYRDIDMVLSGQARPTSDTLKKLIHQNNIRFIVVFKSSRLPHGPVWSDHVALRDHEDGPHDMFGELRGSVLLDGDIYFKRLDAF